MIQSVLDKSETTNNKEKMKIVSEVFQRTRQMGEAEAVCKLIPNMNLNNSNVSCQWVSICTPEERSSRYLKAEKQHIDAGIPLKELEQIDEDDEDEEEDFTEESEEFLESVKFNYI